MPVSVGFDPVLQQRKVAKVSGDTGSARGEVEGKVWRGNRVAKGGRETGRLDRAGRQEGQKSRTKTLVARLAKHSGGRGALSEVDGEKREGVGGELERGCAAPSLH